MEDFSPDTDIDTGTRAPRPARTADLGALIGSRICHDLNNPLGAIGNGIELMELAGHKPGPELALIAESVAHATARLQYLRLAFGAASPGQAVAGPEVAAIVAAHFRNGRITLDWPPLPALERAEAKLALLALMCLESALPFGGYIAATWDDSGWRFAARGERLRELGPLWDSVTGGPAAPGIGAPHVQFLLLPEAARALGRPVALTRAEGRLDLAV